MTEKLSESKTDCVCVCGWGGMVQHPLCEGKVRLLREMPNLEYGCATETHFQVLLVRPPSSGAFWI